MTSVLSKLLQSKRTDLCEAINLTESLIKKLDERRSDDSYFTAVYQRALTIATEHNLETDPPRQQKRKRTDSVLLKDSYVCSTIGRGAFSAQSELHKNLEKDDAFDFQKYFRVDVFNIVYDRFITELSSFNKQLTVYCDCCLQPQISQFFECRETVYFGGKI